MLGPMLASLSLVLAEADTPIQAAPFDRVLELEILAEDEPAIEGRGPTLFTEYEVEFEGTLHIWAISELDLFLQVDDAATGQTIASDDNSGGATTPYVEMEVEQGDWLVLLVAGQPGTSGPVELHLVAALETPSGLAATTAAWAAFLEGKRLVEDGERDAALEVMRSMLPDVLGAAGVGHPNRHAIQANLSVSMHNLGDLDSARVLREEVVTAYARTLPPHHLDRLTAEFLLANSMYLMGDLEQSIALYEVAVEGFKAILPADHPNVLAVLANLAGALGQIGDVHGALAIEESILASQERTLPEDHPDILRTRINLGGSLYEMGDLAGARAMFEQAVAISAATAPEDDPNLLAARGNLATAMIDMGDLAGARALQESVLAVYRRKYPEGHPDLVTIQANLASAVREMGDLEAAKVLYESVLDAREDTLPATHQAVLAARGNLAVIRYEMDDLEGARTMLEAVLTDYKASLPEGHSDILTAQVNLSTSMYTLGEFAEARALQEAVLASYEQLFPQGHPSALAARESLIKTVDELEDITVVHTLVDTQLAGMLLRVLASLGLAPREAGQVVRSEDRRLETIFMLKSPVSADVERRSFELAETMRLVAAEGARSLSHVEKDSALASLLERAARARRSLNDLIAGGVRDELSSVDLSAETTRLSLERDTLEREARRILHERGIATQSISDTAMAESLKENEAVVGYRRMGERLLAHVLTTSGTLTRIDLGSAAELEGLAHAWRDSIGAPVGRNPSSDGSEQGPSRARTQNRAPAGIATQPGLSEDPDIEADLAVGRMLRARILDEVLASAGPDPERLFVCADDFLFLVPFDSLPTNDTSERVGDRVQIVNEVSFARLLTPPPSAIGPRTLLALGGVDYDATGAAPKGLRASSAPIEARTRDGAPHSSGAENRERFETLAQTHGEALATAAAFETAFETEPELLTGSESTKAALATQAAGKRYIHLATHGWFAPETVRSSNDAPPEESGLRMGFEERVSGLAPMTLCGLALAGANRGRDSLGRVSGILTAEELCSLDLSQCELAVLSACETNVGIRRAGQGIQSLQSALYAAGARTSITSLWKVDDAATRRLMEVFYTNLWIEKMGKADALWQAKQALRDEGHPPAHWAGWVLTGDPD